MKRLTPFICFTLLLGLFAFAAMAGEAPTPAAEQTAADLIAHEETLAGLLGYEPQWASKDEAINSRSGCYQEDCTNYGNCALQCDCKRLNCVDLCICDGPEPGCISACYAEFSTCVASCFPQ
ncbi:MAG: hypothetical protein AAGN66_29765, partial [Acidobacteriota bacterium]